MHPATVLTDVPQDADPYHQESFGPVCVLQSFADDATAVAVANDIYNGLTCGIITENATPGLAVARRIRTGIVHVNDQWAHYPF